MVRAAKKKPANGRRKRKKPVKRARISLFRWLVRWVWRGGLALVGVMFFAVVAYGIFDPRTTPYMISEARRLGGIEQQWVDLEAVAPAMARAVVAAEDANFCEHWGFDMAAIRIALDAGSGRGASTISQQVVKNVYLWQGRSWVRKALEAVMTPMLEAVWTKRRILEVYLNVAEFGEGVFGVQAAARANFRVSADRLSSVQAARLAVVLPSPKKRSARAPSGFVRSQAQAAASGAATILADGRAACFES